jgi:REP element-mobilizing transposase RayT
MESEGGIYHVINRGNYRADLFSSDRTKSAFLKCLGEACEKTGWKVHAWCVMTNHYHLAIETPEPNLVDGMSWLQGTFATRFNRLRKEHGHLFQGRYKSLIVDPGRGLGAVCHYIHLNPVRAGLCEVTDLGHWPWSSASWLFSKKERPEWYEPGEFLQAAGDLPDTPVGRRRYLEYLAGLTGNESACKELHFDQMSKGWAIGSKEFKKDLLKDHKAYATARALGEDELAEAKEEVLQDLLRTLLDKAGYSRKQISADGKFADWKVAVAAVMKSRTTVTNAWLRDNLAMGSVHEISRQVAAWVRDPDQQWLKRLR